MAATAAASSPVSLYHVAGDPAPPPETIIAWRAVDIAPQPDGQLFDVRHGEACLGTWRIRLPGRHNVGNALAVIAAATDLGVERDALRAALATYRGAGRRFEVLGRAGFVTVVDDYAHHPTEIAATLAAARERFPDGRVLAVLQPHTYSRVAALATDFSAALLAADWVAITPIFAARETPPESGASPVRLAAGVPGALLPADLEQAAELAAAAATAHDVVLFLGAGDIPRASRACLHRLRSATLQTLLERAEAEGSWRHRAGPRAAGRAHLAQGGRPGGRCRSRPRGAGPGRMVAAGPGAGRPGPRPRPRHQRPGGRRRLAGPGAGQPLRGLAGGARSRRRHGLGDGRERGEPGRPGPRAGPRRVVRPRGRGGHPGQRGGRGGDQRRRPWLGDGRQRGGSQRRGP